jgi:hypothetical protein
VIPDDEDRLGPEFKRREWWFMLGVIVVLAIVLKLIFF